MAATTQKKTKDQRNSKVVKKSKNTVCEPKKSSVNRKGTTKVVVKFNCGFPNTLAIRGEGIQELTWEKGCPMKNVKADEWIWETSKPFSTKVKFKVLLNDKEYEAGDNHTLECGKSIICVPEFSI